MVFFWSLKFYNEVHTVSHSFCFLLIIVLHTLKYFSMLYCSFVPNEQRCIVPDYGTSPLTSADRLALIRDTSISEAETYMFNPAAVANGTTSTTLPKLLNNTVIELVWVALCAYQL